MLFHLVDDDDGVIDEKAERHDHSEDRDLMERATGEGRSEERDRRGQGKGGSDDDGGAPSHDEEDDHDHHQRSREKIHTQVRETFVGVARLIEYDLDRDSVAHSGGKGVHDLESLLGPFVDAPVRLDFRSHVHRAASVREPDLSGRAPPVALGTSDVAQSQ